MLVSTIEQALAEVVDRHRVLYEDRTIDARLKAIIRAGGHTNVTEDDVRHILRKSRSVFFDTHVGLCQVTTRRRICVSNPSLVFLN
jgi:orotate phosphoribosyltransferase